MSSRGSKAAPAESGTGATRPAARPPGLERIVKLPVQLSVRIAEKRIELAQVLSLAPGALLTFAKPCDDLLDLYVNNRRFCRGEAVKAGERYGLRILDTVRS
ncbi:MAG: FliM/FliN family flagellar motor switch protein [Planctomycetes bacterium]|nr:FliM/FliN family flagellar motor switch protein [Planctomycetota bacterium]